MVNNTSFDTSCLLIFALRCRLEKHRDRLETAAGQGRLTGLGVIKWSRWVVKWAQRKSSSSQRIPSTTTELRRIRYVENRYCLLVRRNDVFFVFSYLEKKPSKDRPGSYVEISRTPFLGLFANRRNPTDRIKRWSRKNRTFRRCETRSSGFFFLPSRTVSRRRKFCTSAHARLS